jgi:hypothetical protein
MRRVLVVLAACGASSEPVTPPPADAAVPIGCAGYWSLVELFPERTSCSGLGRKRAEIIVDVVAGAYRARHATGGTFEITHASALGEPCALNIAESGHIDAIDTSYEMAWQIGGATRGVYRDTEAWTECAHEFRALSARRELTAEDITLDLAAVRAAVLAWWPRYAGCRRPPELQREPGLSAVPADVLFEADGRVTRIRARGRTHHVACSMHGCPCLEVPNPTGEPQHVALPLPVP